MKKRICVVSVLLALNGIVFAAPVTTNDGQAVAWGTRQRAVDQDSDGSLLNPVDHVEDFQVGIPDTAEELEVELDHDEDKLNIPEYDDISELNGESFDNDDNDKDITVSSDVSNLISATVKPVQQPEQDVKTSETETVLKDNTVVSSTLVPTASTSPSTAVEPTPEASDGASKSFFTEKQEQIIEYARNAVGMRYLLAVVTGFVLVVSLALTACCYFTCWKRKQQINGKKMKAKTFSEFLTSIADEFSDLPGEHEYVKLLDWGRSDHQPSATREDGQQRSGNTRTTRATEQRDDGNESDESCQETDDCFYDESSGYVPDGDLGRML